MLEINEIIVFSEHLFLFPTNNKFTLSHFDEFVVNNTAYGKIIVSNLGCYFLVGGSYYGRHVS